MVKRTSRDTHRKLSCPWLLFISHASSLQLIRFTPFRDFTPVLLNSPPPPPPLSPNPPPPSAQRLDSVKDSEKAMFETSAEDLVLAERRAAEREVRRGQEAREAKRQAEEEMRQLASEQLRAAREGHRGAVSRLRARFDVQRESVPDMNAILYDKVEHRAKAVISLKATTEAAASELRSSNARNEEKRAKVNAGREEEKLTILARGGNPYQVFRQRDEERRLARESKRIKETLSSNMGELQSRLLKQNKEAAEKRAKEEAKRVMVEEKAKSITAVGKEQKNDAFMRKAPTPPLPLPLHPSASGYSHVRSFCLDRHSPSPSSLRYMFPSDHLPLLAILSCTLSSWHALVSVFLISGCVLLAFR